MLIIEIICPDLFNPILLCYVEIKILYFSDQQDSGTEKRNAEVKYGLSKRVMQIVIYIYKI